MTTCEDDECERERESEREREREINERKERYYKQR